MSMRITEKKTAGDRINTAKTKMKKLFLMIAVMLGFAFGANAQSDQCGFTNSEGYLSAYVSDLRNEEDGGYRNCNITTEPSVDQPSDGKVICKIVYITKDGERETITWQLNFYKSGSCMNQISLDSPAKRVVSIEIWGAQCKSVNRNDY